MLVGLLNLVHAAFAVEQRTGGGVTSCRSHAINIQLISPLSESTIILKLVKCSHKSNSSTFLPCQTVHRKVQVQVILSFATNHILRIS